MLAYYYLNTHTLTVVVKGAGGSGVTGATVTATLVDRAGTALTGQTWPLTLSDDGGGSYSGTVDHDLNLVAGQRFTAQVTVVSGANRAYVEEEGEAVLDSD